jgi:hypothetical protein
MSGRFDASLPTPYAENWRKAYRSGSADSPRTASYQAPGGEAIPFIQKGFRFSGGQAQDTAEYPFGGLWSNEYLNEKPQTLNVEGYVRGPAYIVQRNRLIEALRVPTGDDNPGYIDLPFWGRFPVVVGDNYEISESVREQGQCEVSIPFRRAGVSISDRAEALLSTGAQLENAAAKIQAAATDDFESRLTGGKGSSPGSNNPDTGEEGDGSDSGDGGSDPGGGPDSGEGGDSSGGSDPGDGGDTGNSPGQGNEGGGDVMLDNAAFASAFSQIKSTLLNIIGRIQGAKTTLNTMTGKALGLTSLINQGVRSPRELAQALFNAGTSIAGGIMEIKNSAEMYGKIAGTLLDGVSASGKPALPSPDNEKNTLLSFLLSDTYTLSGDTVTAKQTATKAAVENLYKTMAFSVSIQIITQYDFLTHRKATAYWQLFKKLEESINRENPVVYAALQDARTVLSQTLSGKALSREMTRTIPAPAPLLYAAHYLGCDEDKIRELNTISDSFAVEGSLVYV